MSADSFVAFYGLRWEILSPTAAQLDLLESRKDLRVVAARRVGLDYWWALTAQQTGYVLFVGRLIAQLGWEGGSAASLSEAEFARLTQEVRTSLESCGFSDSPSLHLQFVPNA